MANKKTAIIISILSIILLGIMFGYIMYDNNTPIVKENTTIYNDNILALEENENILLFETLAEEERTTPNTLIIYKTYYTVCKHYIKSYEDIDVTMVNLTEKEFREKNRKWSLAKFSSREIELAKEEEKFCNEHYKLKLKNNLVVIYKIDEAGLETEYEQTEITTEYLTNEDIFKLITGIEVYGKENLSNTMEDYE